MDLDPVQIFLTCCRPYRFDPPLDFVTAAPLSFLGPADPAAAFESISERYSPAELVERGIAVYSDGDERVRLRPELNKANIPLFWLQFADPNALPVLATNSCCIGRSEWPFFAVMEDDQTLQRFGRTDNQLLLTACLEDAILLQSLGLAAAPLSGLGELVDADLKRLEEVFGVACEAGSRADDQSTNTPPGPSPSPAQAAVSGEPGPPGGTVEVAETCGLVIVDWKPSALSLDSPAELGAASRHLSDLEKFRELDLTDVAVWTPSPGRFEAIQFAVDRRDVGWLSDAFTKSLHADARGFHESRDAKINGSERFDLVSATEQVLETSLKPARDEMDRRKQRAALATYQRIAHAEVVAPLLREAQAATDPFERIQRIQIAKFAALFMATFPTALEAEINAPPTANTPDRRKDRPMNDLLALGGQISRLGEELSSGKKRPKTTLWKPRPPTIDTALWRNFDSRAKK